MTTAATTGPAREGDWIKVHGLPGMPPRDGLVLEVLGRPGHEHYRVRWDEEHESIFFPTEATQVVVHHPSPRPTRPRHP